MNILNVEKIQKAIEKGWVTKRKHPDADLYILNYSKEAQMEWIWEKETTMICRGLIVDGEWNVVARPFQKFFTLDQLTSLRNSVHHLYGLKFKTMFDGPFKVFDKLDGSLGIAYPLGDKIKIATRGSFESEMAIKASQMLENMGMADRKMWESICCGQKECLTDDFTFLFEIIYPDNRIVVDYGNEEKLVLLDVIRKSDGHRSDSMFKAASMKFEAAKEYSHINSIDDFSEDEYNGQEGYVLVFDNGLRVKWKFEEYKRLHYIVSKIDDLVWDVCENGKKIRDVLDKVPDEFYNWVEEKVKDLKTRFKAIEKVAKTEFQRVKHYTSRKDLADKIKDFKYKGLVFAMLDEKDCSPSIWRIVKEQIKNERRFDTPSVCS